MGAQRVCGGSPLRAGVAWTLDWVLCLSSCSRTSYSASWRDGKPSKTQQLCEWRWGRTETWGRGWWVLSSCGQASATRRHLSGSSSLIWRARCLLLSGSKHLGAARDSWKQLCTTQSSSQALLHAPQAWGRTGVCGGVHAVLGCQGCLVPAPAEAGQHPGSLLAARGLAMPAEVSSHSPEPHGVRSRGRTAQADKTGESLLQEMVAVRLVGQTSPLWALGTVPRGHGGTDLSGDEGGGLSPQTSATSHTPTHVPVCLGL